jgi:hypothetical protein
MFLSFPPQIEPLEGRIAPAVILDYRLTDLDGSNGFTLTGENDGDGAGEQLSAAGDVNGDGFDDIVLSANRASEHGTESGAVYVVFGTPSGLAAQTPLSSLDGTNGFKIKGGAAFDLAGIFVGSAGDLNGDGCDEVIFRAGTDAFVIYGSHSVFPATFELSDIKGTKGFRITNGYAIANGIGDFNGDGRADLFVESPAENGVATAHVLFGRTDFPEVVSLDNLAEANGFQFAGLIGTFANHSIGHADVNGDGKSDLILGERTSADFIENSPGVAYVVFGRNGGIGTSLDVATLNGTTGFKMTGLMSSFGAAAVAGAGDINHDGFDDVIVGSLGNFLSYVIFGKADAFATSVDVKTLNGTAGFQIGSEKFQFFPSDTTVAGAGDLNADGFDDLIVGDTGDSTVVIYGRASGFESVASLQNLDGTNGFRLSGETLFVGLNAAASSAGDFNGDGFADLIVNESRNTDSGSLGLTHLVYGKSSLTTASFEVGAREVRFVEPDGDHVSIQINKGKIADQRLILAAVPNGLLLEEFTLQKGAGAGMKATISVSASGVPSPTAGSVQAGQIRISQGVSLSRLDIHGDVSLLQLVGKLGTVKVDSVGQNRELFPIISSTEVLTEKGSVGSLQIDGNVTDSFLTFFSPVKRVSIGGDLVNSRLHTSFPLPRLDVSGSVIDSGLLGDGPEHPKTAAASIVFNSIRIGGDFAYSGIYAGYDISDTPTRGSSIGTVTISGKLIASNIVAGASEGNDGQFGTNDDFTIADGNRLVASIGLVSIGGGVEAADPAEGFIYGIVAEKIGTVRTGAESAPLLRGARNDLVPQPVGGIETQRIREVSLALLGRLEVASLDGKTGFKVNGATETDSLGNSVNGAGDVNGDGFADFIVGAPHAAGDEANAGAAYVIFGTATGFPSDINVADLNGSNGFKISGSAAGDLVGLNVRAAGDVNADGFADVLIGGGTRMGSTGDGYVVFGHSNPFTQNVSLNALDGTNSFRIVGVPTTEEGVPPLLTAAGDVNGDGIDDILIAADELNSTGAYVIYGRAGMFDATFALATLDGITGFKIDTDEIHSSFGRTAAGLGDLNGDGIDDIVISAPSAAPHGNASGACYVIFGQMGGLAATFHVADLDGTNGFKISGERSLDFLGEALEGAGDINHDGLADLIIGAWDSDNTAGACYVIFGRSGGFERNLDVSALNGTNGFKILSASIFAETGYAVGGHADFNGDGFDDLVIGAPGVFFETKGTGAAYVLFGRADGFEPTFSLRALNGTNGFKILGEAKIDSFGRTVSFAGDLNGDHFADVVVGTGFEYLPGASAGYVVFGTPAVQVDERTVAYTEADGDRVILQVKNGTITTGALQFEEVAGQKTYNVKTLDLSGGANLDGAEVDVTVVSSGSQVLHDRSGNVGIPNVGNVILPSSGGPSSVNIEGNVQQVNIPTGAKIKEFKVNSLGVDTDIFPDIAPRFSGAGTLVKLTVLNNITGVDFDIPGAVDRLTVGGDITDSHLTFASKLPLLSVKGDVTGSTLNFAKGAGSVTVFGDVSDTQITALGAALPKNASVATLFSKVTIGGDFERSKLLAGYSAMGAAMNADVVLGKIAIMGALRESSIVAGASTGTDGVFGTEDDELIGGGNRTVAKIASILIGSVAGTATPDDGFGIVAEQIGALKIGKLAQRLVRGVGNDLSPTLLGTTDDVHVREVSA